MNQVEHDQFFKSCESFIIRNIERSSALPSNTKLQNALKYLSIFLSLSTQYEKPINDRKIYDFLDKCAYDTDYICEILERSNVEDKFLELLDFVESYLVDEIEKCLYGHGDMCYSSLFNDLNLVLKIKADEYDYQFKNVCDLLVQGYFFSTEDADRFVRLAAFHKPEDCPD